jgi:shikimate kinase
MRIIFIGMKGGGKTTLGKLLAEKLHIPFLDSDAYLEKMHEEEYGEALSPNEILKKYGATYFSALETKALKHLAQEFAHSDFVLSCGGRTPLQEVNQEILVGLGKIFFLQVEKAVLLQRILAQGIPPFFSYPDDPEKSLDELLAQRLPVYKKLADVTIDASKGTCEELLDAIMMELRDDDKN